MIGGVGHASGSSAVAKAMVMVVIVVLTVVQSAATAKNLKMIRVIVAIAVVFVVISMGVEARVFCSGEAERAIAVTAEVTEVAYCSDGISSTGKNNVEDLEVVGSL
ncbi:hypothetical protein SLA2020_406600 [Shorea laevis]